MGWTTLAGESGPLLLPTTAKRLDWTAFERRNQQLGLLAGAGALAGLLFVRSGGWTLTCRSLLSLAHSSRVRCCRAVHMCAPVLPKLTCRSLVQGGFQLVITVKFQSEEDLEEWVALWTPLARHCWLHEPQTLCYELARSDREPLQVLVFERCVCSAGSQAVLDAGSHSGPSRYTNKAALTEIHQKSEPFLEFGRRAKAITSRAEKQGMSYLETSLGYM